MSEHPSDADLRNAAPTAGERAEMCVAEVFSLADGTTAFTGVLESDVPLLRAGEAELLHDGERLGMLALAGESVPTRRPVRPGNPLPPHWRSVSGALPAGLSAADLRDVSARGSLRLRLTTPGPPAVGEPSDLARPLIAEDAEVAFLRQGINCELGENNLVYTLRFGPDARPKYVWVAWAAAGQEPVLIYRPWRTPPAGVAAIGGGTAQGVELLRAGVNRYSIAPGAREAVDRFLSTFGIADERAERILRASGITAEGMVAREAA